MVCHDIAEAEAIFTGQTTGFSQNRREPVSAQIIEQALCLYLKKRQAISSLAKNHESEVD
jgi:hypothetical protein